MRQQLLNCSRKENCLTIIFPPFAQQLRECIRAGAAGETSPFANAEFWPFNFHKILLCKDLWTTQVLHHHVFDYFRPTHSPLMFYSTVNYHFLTPPNHLVILEWSLIQNKSYTFDFIFFIIKIIDIPPDLLIAFTTPHFCWKSLVTVATLHCKPIPCNDYRDLPV